MKKLLFTMFVIGMCFNSIAQYTIPQKMNWWYESRFGMFIHFGSYSYLGHGEWAFSNESWTKANYQNKVSSNFNPVNFNAGTIARLAKNAGMKYLVITAKHHEGFCMWNTKVESFKDVTGTKPYDLPGFTTFGDRDLLMELKDSCEALGIKFCLYYSILDWNHSSQTLARDPVNTWNVFSNMKSDSARTAYINDMKAQLRELITLYHPHILWFDGDWTYNYGNPTTFLWWTKNDGVALYDTLVKMDSNLLVNERVFRSAGLGDFMCPEQKVPDVAESRPWETNQTMNNSWGYNSSDNSYKTPKALIQQLVDVVSKDGNYLLNIGPKGDGTVPEQSVTILTEIGQWMDINSESIYGTIRSPYSKIPSWGRFTRKQDKLYIHVFLWPDSGSIKITSLSNKIKKIYLLSDSATQFNYTDSNGLTTIKVPQQAPDTINSVIVIDVEGIPQPTTAYIKTSSIYIKGKGQKNTVKNHESLQLIPTIYPSTTTDKSVSWSVSDTTLATINSDGLLTAKAVGAVVVYAKAKDGSEIQGIATITIVEESVIINSLNNNEIMVYPNPAGSGILYIKQNLNDNLSVKIFNYNGQLVLSENTSRNQLTLNISNFPASVYAVCISNGKENKSFKFVKK